MALQTRIGQLYTTPWKSLIIKGIGIEQRNLWDGVLCLHRINVRHASNELNWQVEDHCQHGLDLKNYLVHKLNEEDVRTYLLCFAIKAQPKTGLFGSIIIKAQHSLVVGALLNEALYEILYTRDFNPNSKEFIYFKKEVKKEELSEALIDLCNFYYKLKSEPHLLLNPSFPDTEQEEKGQEEQQIYQCQHCLTVYDEKWGDSLGAVAAGISFQTLEIYQCPTCEAPKEDFVLIDIPASFAAYSS